MSPEPGNWILAALLFLLGANMLVSPGSFTRFTEGLALELRNFERQLLFRDPGWRYRRHRQPLSTKGIRIAGAVLIAYGFLLVAV